MAVVTMDPKRRRTFRGEEKWFPLLTELGHRRLRSALIASGISAQTAGGIVWFIDDQMALERHQTDQSRVRYRQALAELDPEKVRRAIPG